MQQNSRPPPSPHTHLRSERSNFCSAEGVAAAAFFGGDGWGRGGKSFSLKLGLPPPPLLRRRRQFRSLIPTPYSSGLQGKGNGDNIFANLAQHDLYRIKTTSKPGRQRKTFSAPFFPTYAGFPTIFPLRRAAKPGPGKRKEGPDLGIRDLYLPGKKIESLRFLLLSSSSSSFSNGWMSAKKRKNVGESGFGPFPLFSLPFPFASSDISLQDTFRFICKNF